MKKIYSLLFFCVFLTGTHAIAGSDSVVFNIHGTLVSAPCSLPINDMSVTLEDADVTELETGADVFGAEFSIPLTCTSPGDVFFTFNGNHGTDASLLNTSMQSVALKFNCKNAIGVSSLVVLGERIFFGGVTSPVDTNVLCTAYYKKQSGAQSLAPGMVSAALTMTVNLN